jgi:hypothetical protein
VFQSVSYIFIFTGKEQLLQYPEIAKLGVDYGLQNQYSDLANQSFESSPSNQQQQLLYRTIYTKSSLSEVQSQLPKPRLQVPTDIEREQMTSKLAIPIFRVKEQLDKIDKVKHHLD